MKKSLCLLAGIVLCLAAFSGVSYCITWSAPVTIASGTGNSIDARCTIDSNGKVHVVYHGDGSGQNHVYYVTNASGSWSSPLDLTPGGTVCWYSDIMAVGTDIWVVYFSNPGGGPWIYYRKKTGSTWSSQQQVSSLAGSRYPTIGYCNGVGPVVTWHQDSGGDHDIYFSQWSGSSWSAALNISPGTPNPSSTYGSEYPGAAVSRNGDITVAWPDSRTGDYRAQANRRVGGVWQGRVELSTVGAGLYHPGVAPAPDNTVTVVYQGPGSSAIYNNKWNGSSWSAVAQIPTGGVGAPVRPSACADDGGAIHVAIEDNNSAVYYTNNVSGSWAGVTKLSTGSTNSRPHISYAGGKLAVVWHGGGHIYYASATAAMGGIQGHVRDAGSNALSGASITATGPATYNATSDATGYYSVPLAAPGTYSIAASKSGYVTQTKTGQVVSASSTTTCDFNLASNMGGISGYVRNSADSSGISGASVVTNPGSYAATTQSTGYYVITGVPAGSYSATASKIGYGSQTQPGISVTANNTATCNFSLSAGESNLALGVVQYQECGHNNAVNQLGLCAFDGKDGTNPVGGGTKWCCLHNGIQGSGDHSLAYDLGSDCQVTKFVVKSVHLMGEPDYYNTKAFVIETASSLLGPWSPGSAWTMAVTETANSVDTWTHTLSVPQTMRYVRLRVTQPTQGTTSPDWAVRLPEFEVWGNIGTPAAITFDAENYDSGFVAVAGTDYYDTTSGNQGNAAIRGTQNVDIDTCSDAGGGYCVTTVTSGEWMRYRLFGTGTFNIYVRYAGAGTCHLTVDGSNPGSITLANTGGMDTWATAAGPSFTVGASSSSGHILKFYSDSTGFKVNYFTLSPAGSFGSIQGTVKNALGQGIAGAAVSTDTGGYSTTTGSDGSYTLLNVATGSYSVLASADGYTSQTVTGVVVSGGGNSPANLTLADPSAPTAPDVADDGVYTTNLTQLHATLVGSDDPQTDVAEYQYCIGTAPYGTNVLGWTTNGTSTEITRTVALSLDQTYYITAKARNGQGLWSDPATSDGITAARAISRIVDAKGLSDGKAVCLTGKTVIGIFSTMFVIGEDDRTSAIRVNGQTDASPGDQIDIGGILATDNGERVLNSPG